MRRFASLLFIACVTAVSAHAGQSPPTASSRAGTACADLPISPGPNQLTQSGCAGQCSSSRGYCLSTCRDSFCRAVCNDRYQSCLSSCRR